MSDNIHVNREQLGRIAAEHAEAITGALTDVATALRPVQQLSGSTIFGPSSAGEWMGRVFAAASADLDAMVGEVEKAAQGLVTATSEAASSVGSTDEAATVAYAAQARALANRAPVAAARTIPPAPSPPAPAGAADSSSSGGTP